MFFVYFISIIAGLLFGVTESLNKNITEKKYSAFSYVFLQVSLNNLFFLIPFIFFGSFVSQPIAYIYLGAAALFFLISNTFIIKAYKTEDISSLNILSKLSLIIPFLGGIFLLHETVSYINIIGVLSVVLGIFVIFYEGKKIKLSTGFLFAIFGGAAGGIAVYLRKISLFYFNPISTIFLIQVILIILLLSNPRTFRDVKPIFAKYKKKILLARVSAVFGLYLIYWAFSKGNISIINTNYEAAFLLSTSLIGVTIMNEKKNIAKKLTGSLFCVIGIILLNFF